MLKLLKFFLLLSNLLWAQASLSDVLFKYYQIKESWPDQIDVSVQDIPAGVLLVDVREEEERLVSMIPNAITKEQLEKRIAKNDFDKSQSIYVYCTIGYRSGIYAQELREKGFSSYNMIGGVLAWSFAHKNFVKKDSILTDSVHVYGKEWNFLNADYIPVW